MLFGGEGLFDTYTTEETVIDADPFKIDTGSAFFDREYATVIDEETVEPNVEKHINYADGKTPVETLVIGENVKYIRAYAFAGFASLKTVVFESDPEIEDGAFSLCPKLENVVYKYGVTPQNIFDFFKLSSNPDSSGSYKRVKINNAPEVPEAILADVTAEKVESTPVPEVQVETPAEAPAEQPTVTTEDESVYGMPNTSTEEVPTEQYTEETPVTEAPEQTPTVEETPAEETPVAAEEPETKKKKGGFFSGLFGGKDKGAKAKDAPKKTAGLDFEETEEPVTMPTPRAKTEVKDLDILPQKPLFNGVCGVKSTFPTDATVIVVPNFVKLPNKVIEIEYVSLDFFRGLAQDYPSIRTIILPSGVVELKNESIEIIAENNYSIEVSPKCAFLKRQLENAGVSVTVYNESDYYDQFPG